jgi:hypothetical protein
MSGFKWKGMMEFRAFKDGELIWQDDTENTLSHEGQRAVLDLYFRDIVDTTTPTTFYIRLCNATLDKTNSLTDLTGEPAGTSDGYDAQVVARTSIGWPSLVTVSSGGSTDYEVTSLQVTFNATGTGWGPVTTAVIATGTGVTTGSYLIAFTTLSQSRTLASGETLKVTYKVRLTPCT